MKIQGKGVSGGVVTKMLVLCILSAATAFAYSKRAEIIERIAILQSSRKQIDSEPESANTKDTKDTKDTASTPDAPQSEGAPVEPVVEVTPVVEAAAPTPAPVVVEVEPTLDHEAIAASSTLWPKQVSLTKPVAFPIVFNGRVAGEASVPVGTVLALSRVVAGANPTGGVEVVYQGATRIIPADSTDLISRATAMRNGVGASSAPVQKSAKPRVAEIASTPRPVAAAAAPSGAPSVKPADRITIEVVRKKGTRIEGGDWDDKKDRIALKVKFSNSDAKVAFDNFKAEVYTYGQSILDPKMTKLLGSQTFPFSLPAFGKHEFSTDECVTSYDKTGVRFGHQYQGWIIRIRDAEGNLVLEKATNPTLAKSAEKLIKLSVNQEVAR